MTILSREELAARLQTKFKDAPIDVTEFMFRSPGLSSLQVAAVETELGTEFAQSFRDALFRYRLDPLTLGPVTLGSREDFASYLIEANVDPATPWWGDGPRQGEMLLVGSSDGFAIIVNAPLGGVLAFRHGADPSSAELVADDLDVFVRAIGSAAVLGRAAVDPATEQGLHPSVMWNELR